MNTRKKGFIQNFILKYREKYIIKKIKNRFLKMKRYEIFKKIYLNKQWSPDEKFDYKFYSGIGSHTPELVNTYIDEIEKFLLSLSEKPNVVDLGCGDFFIGSKIRQLCNKYIAVDIVDELIYYNKKKYKHLNVDFRILDITCDELPSGDICFIRQVLQHLSNELIINFVKLIKNKYKYLIITEHLPQSKNFVPNINISTGSDIRLNDKSGIVLTVTPFNLKVIKEINLCETYSDSITGVLKTKLLQLKN